MSTGILVHRLTPHLNAAWSLRQWAHQHLPPPTAGDDGLEFDLFLRLGQLLTEGGDVDLIALSRELGCTPQRLRQLLLQWLQAGLLAQAGSQVQPTARFGELLQQFTEASNRHYVPRRELRDHQLVVDSNLAPDQVDFIEMVYDRFHDLGWLYLHNFGAVCFLMALLVQKVAALHRRRARTVSGHVVARRPDGRGFSLGDPSRVLPGQVAGHAFAVLDDGVLVDFGLGNLRRYFTRSFPWGVACLPQGERQPGLAGELVLPRGGLMQWKDDWSAPESAAEFSKLEPLAQQLVHRYAAHHGLSPRLAGEPAPVPDTQPGELLEAALPAAAPALRAVSGG